MQQLGEELCATKRAYVARNDLYCLTLSFMFHFSFFFVKCLIINHFGIMKHLPSMFHFKFHVSFFKTLRERLRAPSVFLNRSHSVFKSLPQCF